MTVVVKRLEDINYSEVKRFVGFCESSDDLAVTSDDDSGTFICPVVAREVKIQGGVCQETRSTCKEHN